MTVLLDSTSPPNTQILPLTHPLTTECSTTTKTSTYTANLFQMLMPLFLYKTDDLSKQIHHVVQLTLSAIAFSGYVVALLICIGGFTKMALITVLLSTTNLAGAYVAYEANLQQSLSNSADKIEKQTDKFEKQNELLEKHVSDLGQINTELKETSEDLKETNEDLKTQVSLFEEQNHELKGNIEDLKETNEDLKNQVSLFEEQNHELKENIEDLAGANISLHTKISLLKEEVKTLKRCSRKLRKTSQILKKEVSLFREQNQQFFSLAQLYQEEAKTLLSKNQKYSLSQIELLKQFSEKITYSNHLWEEIFGQIKANNKIHKRIIQQHTTALKSLQSPELKEAIKRDIQEASTEFGNLRQEITALLEDVSEQKNLLITLKKEHQEILEQKRELLEKEKELYEANKAQTEELKTCIAQLKALPQRLT